MAAPQYHPFPNTHWSLVRRAGADSHQPDPKARRLAMNTLLTRYEPALKSYLLKRHLGDDADDILQAFVADNVLEREMLRHADEGRGKFRTFLIASLNHFATSWRRSNARLASSLDDSVAASLASDDPTPVAQIEAAWARALVHHVVAAMRERCHAMGQEDVWAVFEGRMLRAVFENRPPVPYETLASRLGLRSPTQVYNLLETAKRLYKRLLRVAVSEYEHDEANIEAEMMDLRNSFAAIGALDESAAWCEDPAAILKTQLDAPLLADLLTAPAAEESRLRGLISDPSATFADQLLSASPNPDLLEAIKNFARDVCNQVENPLYGPPANILYYAAIAAALVHANAHITTLTPTQLHKGFTWALTQPASKSLVGLFQQALQRAR
ncbi:MAG: hypothetical protein FWD61_16695 [Phycisphaerales bacterium]|nr:hypothetical protein [Phycisphaerales bacterium]